MEPLTARQLYRWLQIKGYGVHVLRTDCGRPVAVLDMRDHSVPPLDHEMSEFNRLRWEIAELVEGNARAVAAEHNLNQGVPL